LRLRRAGTASRGPLNADVRCHLSRVSTAIGLCTLTASAVFSIWIMLQGAGGTFRWSWFYPWVLSPYVAFGILCVKLAHRSSTSRRAALVAAVIVSVISVYAYVNAMLVDVSSTSALIFVFMPLYLFIGGFAVFGVSMLISRFLGSRSDT